jgi:hypothetical protein
MASVYQLQQLQAMSDAIECKASTLLSPEGSLFPAGSILPQKGQPGARERSLSSRIFHRAFSDVDRSLFRRNP